MIIDKPVIYKTLRNIALFYVIYFFSGNILRGAVSPNWIGELAWVALWCAIVWLIVICPFIKDTKREPDPLERRLYKAREREKDVKQRTLAMPTISDETQTLRTARLSDIRNCLSDTPWEWLWADTSTLTRLYLCAEKETCPAIIHIDEKDRVDYIEATIGGHMERFVNRAYAESKKMESAILAAPVNAFMEVSIPDASWSWLNYEERKIILTSKARGLKSCSAVLKQQSDGHITSILVSSKGEKAKRIYLKKASAPCNASDKPAQKLPEASCDHGNEITPSAVQSPVEAPRMSNGMPSVGEQANKEESAPVDVESEGPLLNPSDTPELEDWVIEANAKNIAESMAQSLEEQACEADSQGKPTVSIKWPEGLQTVTEVKALTKILVGRCGFTNASIDAEKMTITLDLPVPSNEDNEEYESFTEDD